MTREEQRIQEAKDRFSDDQIYPISKVYAFVEGAKWADEHPNLYNDENYHTVKVSCLDELHRKAALYDVFLDKACKWLQENVNKYSYVMEVEGTKYREIHFTDSLIEDFKKAMEE